MPYVGRSEKSKKYLSTAVLEAGTLGKRHQDQ